MSRRDSFQDPYEHPRGDGLATFSAAGLMAMELPPVQWCVPGLLPEGVTILAGKPKLGKSWLSLNLALAVASGGLALGARRVERGECLYMALEDNQRRLQKRLGKLLNGNEPPAGLHIATAWQTMDSGGAESLDNWLREHPECRLVVVDVLQKVRPHTASNQSVYASDYHALQALHEAAAKHSVAVLVIHHLRKAEATDPLDEISGSTGLSGAADGMLVLKRDRGRGDAYLYVDGRDIEEPAEHALTWDSERCIWSLAGDAKEFRTSQERADILRVLEKTSQGMTPTEIANALDRNPNSTKKLVWTMSRDGQITSDSGRYYPVTRNSGNSVTEADDPVTQVSGHRKPSDTGEAPHENGTDADPSYPVTKVTSYPDSSIARTADNVRRLTTDEVARVQRLIQDGREPSLARREVLGADL